MHYIECGDARVAYRVDGQGPGLLLISGTGGDGDSNWGHLLDALTPAWTVLRPDYAGAGATRDSGAPLTLAGLASQVAAAVDACRISRCVVVGYSLGAAIATVLADRRPDLVRGLLLVGGFARGDARQTMMLALWEKLIATDRDAMASLVMINGFSPAFLARMSSAEQRAMQRQIVEFNDWEGMLRQIELGARVDVRDAASRLRVPTRVVGCRQDQVVPAAQAMALAALIRDARYAEIDTGHLTMFEDPAALLAQLQAFAAALPDDPAR
ncbi:alpha/beta fold hydrolase [Chitinasiproducens palmae]|uniref:Pimeloyl-ACP methyl ester carboxylesterase n=1 Tax=Chitinasiproducens palmae TaxID=1770053 RepID=A0A1H2PJ81_9BURK|nr:alpha/beta fold hydrolase [Chitinasiproducens palmae]SDV46419.1 Pimeloyl-ACP methyl ester carboxylesterase [Chitinasiproducens palmae]